MVITKTIQIQITSKNKQFYQDRGYDTTNSKLTIDVNDLDASSQYKVDMICDTCQKEFKTTAMTYINTYRKHEKHICNICRKKYDNKNLKRKGFTPQQINYMFKQV